MRYLKQALAAVMFLATFALLVSESLDSKAFAQSASSSTVCLNNQPCVTITCTDNQPCSSSQTPNIEDPDIEDFLDNIEDTMDD